MKYKKIRVTAYVLAAAVTFSGMSLTVNAAGADSVLPSGGIGLSIVKAIMDSFHQQCGVINHENGVEFWMELESNHQM